MADNNSGKNFEVINIKKAQYNRERKLSAQKTEQRTVSPAPKRTAAATVRSNTRPVRPQYPRTYNSYNDAAVRSEQDVFGSFAQTAGEYVGDYVKDRRRRRIREKALEPVVIRKRVKAKAFPVSFIFYALIMTCTFMFIAFNYSVTNEISYDTSKLEEEIKLQQTEKERLSVALEKRNDLAYIEDVAANRLGMVKSTDIVKQYVSISGSDKIVVSDNNTDKAYFGTTMNSLKRSVGKIFR